jgi:hypothetical protein
MDTVVPPALKTDRLHETIHNNEHVIRGGAFVHQIDNRSSLPVADASSNNVLDANVDVKRFDASPIESVTAKPLMGPVPN